MKGNLNYSLPNENKYMKEKVQEKSEDRTEVDKSYSTIVIRLNLGQKP